MTEKMIQDLMKEMTQDLRRFEWLMVHVNTNREDIDRKMKEYEESCPDMEDSFDNKKEETLTKGDYVLATKYNDGDPCDQFCVGVFREMLTDNSGNVTDRYLVEDNDGYLFRGFRRCERISEQTGQILIAALPHIIGRPGKSLWYWVQHLEELQEYINSPTTYIGKTVEDEEFGRGSIVDETDTTVGVRFSKDSLKVHYIRKSDLCRNGLCFFCIQSEGTIDSGGVTPWGAWIDIPCPKCTK